MPPQMPITPRKRFRMRKSKTIIERARLREPKQKDARWIGDAFASQSVDQIDQRLMMDCNRLFAVKVC